MIEKEIFNAGLNRFYPVVILRDQSGSDVDQMDHNEVIIDRDDYADMRLKEGMNDQEIFNFALMGIV